MLFDAIPLAGGATTPASYSLPHRGVRCAVSGRHRRRVLHTPLLSYGTEKAIRRTLAGRIIRAGFRTASASGFSDHLYPPGTAEQGGFRLLLNILREPLAGKESCCRYRRRSGTGNAAHGSRSASSFTGPSTMDTPPAGVPPNRTCPASRAVGETSRGP